MQVLGNVKGVVATVVSVLLFKNMVSWAGCSGYAIAIGGVFLYSDQKRKSREAAAASNNTSATRQHGKLGSGFDGCSAGGSSESETSPLLNPQSSEGKSSATALGDAEKLSRYSSKNMGNVEDYGDARPRGSCSWKLQQLVGGP